MMGMENREWKWEWKWEWERKGISGDTYDGFDLPT